MVSFVTIERDYYGLNSKILGVRKKIPPEKSPRKGSRVGLGLS